MNQLLLRLGKVLLRAALDESLRSALPFVYRRLDSEIPELLIHRAPPAKIEGIIASAIGDAMGKRPSRRRSEEHTSELHHTDISRMPSSA